MVVCFVCECNHKRLWERCKLYMGGNRVTVTAMYKPSTPPYTRAVYGSWTWPCTWPVHGRVRAVYVYMARVHGRVYRPTRPCMYTVRVCTWPVYTADYVYGPCTWPCTDRVQVYTAHTRTVPGRVDGRIRAGRRPCTGRVYGGVSTMYTAVSCTSRVHKWPCVHDRVHGSVHDRVHGGYSAVYGPCTLNNN